MERDKNRKLFAMLCAIFNQNQISQLIDNYQMKESNKRPQKLNDFLTFGNADKEKFVSFYWDPSIIFNIFLIKYFN